CLCSGRLLLCDWNACKTAQTNGLRGLQVKIAFRQVDATAVFGEEGLRMARAAAWFIELQAGETAEPGTGNLQLVKLRLETLKTVEELSARGQECIDRAVNDGFCPEQAQSPESAKLLYGKVCEGMGSAHK